MKVGDVIKASPVACNACGKTSACEGEIIQLATCPEGTRATVIFPRWPAGWCSIGELIYCPDHKVAIRRAIVVDGVMVDELIKDWV